MIRFGFQPSVSLRQSIMSSSLCDPVLMLPSVINMVNSKLSASMQLRHPLLAARLSSQTSHLSRDMRTLISPSVTVVHSHSSHLILCVGAPVSVTSTVATLYVQLSLSNKSIPRSSAPHLSVSVTAIQSSVSGVCLTRTPFS